MTAPYLLISDLDDTLLGNEEALRRFEQYFASLAPGVAVVYASGRFCDSICRDVESTALPRPIATIGGVGTEIRYYPSGELDRDWVERMSRNWSGARVRESLAGEADLQPQPEADQSEFKVSYYLYDAPEDRLRELKAMLGAQGLQADYVYSSHRDLDFLPAGINKGSAAEFLATKLGYDPDHVVVAGNSGNDAELFRYGFLGIVVGNAHQELKEYARDRRVYLAEKEIADGVREGLQHWLEK